MKIFIDYIIGPDIPEKQLFAEDFKVNDLYKNEYIIKDSIEQTVRHDMIHIYYNIDIEYVEKLFEFTNKYKHQSIIINREIRHLNDPVTPIPGLIISF